MFRALSSPTRIKILEILTHKEMHLTGLAKEIGISVPVTSRHIKILEKSNLVNKKVFGNTHILTAKTKNLEHLLETFNEKHSVEINKERSLFDALKQLPGIEIKKFGKNQYIKSIDGEDGYYIYEVNGKLPDMPINKFIINRNLSLDLKKIVTIKKKNIKINLKKTNGK